MPKLAAIIPAVWLIVFLWTGAFFAGAARLRRRAADLDGQPETD